MIFSKSALQIVNITKGAPESLQAVKIERDGTVAAGNGKVVIVVEPTREEATKTLVSFGIAERRPIEAVLSALTVREIIKGLPRDTTFGGLLEYCAIYPAEDASGELCIKINDGLRVKAWRVRPLRSRFPDYTATIRSVYSYAISGGQDAKRTVSCRAIVNRDRFAEMIAVMETVSVWTGGDSFSPAWLEFTGGGLVYRTVNKITGQRSIAVVYSSLITGKQWLELNDWERRTCNAVSQRNGGATGTVKICPRRKEA